LIQISHKYFGGRECGKAGFHAPRPTGS